MRTVFSHRQVMPSRASDGDTTQALTPTIVAGVTAHTAELARPADTPPLLFAFQHGKDNQPRPMSEHEIRELGDAFTQRVLLTSATIPVTLGDLITAIEASAGPAKLIRKMFLVDEGAMPHQVNPDFALNTRLVFSWQETSQTAPDILLSTVPSTDDPTALLQLIAWSDTNQAFHFFERDHERIAWGWAGSSFDALVSPTRGKGPFDSHINGGLVMKELKAPWTHGAPRTTPSRLRFMARRASSKPKPSCSRSPAPNNLNPSLRAGFGDGRLDASSAT